jgi:hypothetical protein
MLSVLTLTLFTMVILNTFFSCRRVTKNSFRAASYEIPQGLTKLTPVSPAETIVIFLGAACGTVALAAAAFPPSLSSSKLLLAGFSPPPRFGDTMDVTLTVQMHPAPGSVTSRITPQ